MTVTLTLAEVEDLARRALIACNTSETNAASVARSVVAAEHDGIHSHGLARLPTYCEHAKCGKIDGQATPLSTQTGAAALRVDACDGFAHPAIDIGMETLLPLARYAGIAAMAVTNSYNCGVVGYHMERIATEGLLGLGFVNAPGSIAPWGGTRPVFGTNPIACGVPRKDGPPMVIDQSSSVVAKSEIMVHAQKDEPIPEGWAFAADGKPTTDAKAALAGTMAPLGGYKGAGLAMLVEIMAAGMTGAHFAFQASSFADNEGGPPRTGQFFIAINPDATAGEDFEGRFEALFSEITGQSGARLPGGRRLEARARTEKEGVTFRRALHERILGYCDV